MGVARTVTILVSGMNDISLRTHTRVLREKELRSQKDSLLNL